MQKCDLEALYQSFYLSMVLDGSTQTKICLPNYTKSVKDQGVHSIAVYLVGLLIHGPMKKL